MHQSIIEISRFRLISSGSELYLLLFNDAALAGDKALIEVFIDNPISQ